MADDVKYLKAEGEDGYRGKDKNQWLVSVSSNTMIICTGLYPISVNVKPESGSAVIATTYALDDQLKTQKNITWTNWEKGWVTTESDDVLLYPVSAMRIGTNGVVTVNLVAGKAG